MDRNYGRWRRKLILSARISEKSKILLVLSEKSPVLSVILRCFRKRTKKKSPANPHGYWTFWRRVRDSNPRSLSGHSISSAAPSTTRTTLHMSIRKSFPNLLERTDGKNNKIFGFSNCETPYKYWISYGQN